MSLEEALAFIADDELLEVTPRNLPLRKAELTASASKRRGREGRGPWNDPIRAGHRCALREECPAASLGANEDATNFGQASPPPGARFVSISSEMERTCAVTVEGHHRSPATASPASSGGATARDVSASPGHLFVTYDTLTIRRPSICCMNAHSPDFL